MKYIKAVVLSLIVGLALNAHSQDMTEKEKKAVKKEMVKKAKGTDALLLKEMFEKCSDTNSGPN